MMQLAALIRLTLRELWARKITAGLLIVSTLIWVILALALNLDIVDGTLAGLRIFGQDTEATDTVVDQDTGEVIRQALSLKDIVIGVESFIAAATYWGGCLLGLFATASLLPSMLEPGRAALLLSKPLPRWHVLLGHLLAVLLTVGALVVYLFGAVWLVMSLKSGIWNLRFLLCIPLVVAMFAVMYSVVVLVGVTVRSAPLALILAYGLIFASIILAARTPLEPQLYPPWRQLYVGLYYVLPNFAEITGLITQLIGMPNVDVSPVPLITSLLFGMVLLGTAFLLFQRRDL